MPLARNRLGGALIGIALVAGPAACSIMTSVDGLAGGVTANGEGPPTGPGDGSAPRVDGASAGDASGGSSGGSGGDDGGGSSGGVDANGGDDGGGGSSSGGSDSGGAGSDAGADTGSAVDAGWCGTQTGALFCVDFDEGTLASHFDQVSGKGGAASLDTGNPQSPPNVMLVQTNAGANVIDVAGYKAFNSLSLASGMVLTASADVRVAQADQSKSSDATPFEIELVDSFGTDWELQLELIWNANAGAFNAYLVENSDLPDGGNPWYQTPAGQLSMDAWKRVTIELALGPAAVPLTGKLLVDGATLATATLHPTTVGAKAQIIVGTSWVNPGNSTWNIRFDDVTFTAK